MKRVEAFHRAGKDGVTISVIIVFRDKQLRKFLD